MSCASYILLLTIDKEPFLTVKFRLCNSTLISGTVDYRQNLITGCNFSRWSKIFRQWPDNAYCSPGTSLIMLYYCYMIEDVFEA